LDRASSEITVVEPDSDHANKGHFDFIDKYAGDETATKAIFEHFRST
jgi:hypothetical protein